VGYKKHTLRIVFKKFNRWYLIPVSTFIDGANTSDGKFLIPFLADVKQRLNLQIKFLVADMAYLSAPDKKIARTEYHTAVVTKVRSDMKAPDFLDPDGCPTCDYWGQRLQFYDFDSETGKHIFVKPDEGRECRICPFSPNCPDTFYFHPDEDEYFLGGLPLQSRLAKSLLRRIRPQVEKGNEEDKHRFYLESFFLNSLDLAKFLGHLADSCKLLTLLAETKTNTKSAVHQALKAVNPQLEINFPKYFS